MANETIKILGLKELNAALQQLPVKVEKSILRGGMRAASKEFEKIALSHIPKRSGKLAASLKTRTRSRRGQVTATVSLGGKDAYYAHMVEFGTAAHFIKGRKKGLFINGVYRSKVKHPGTAPKPMMRPAFDEGAPAALKAFAEYVRGRLIKNGSL